MDMLTYYPLHKADTLTNIFPTYFPSEALNMDAWDKEAVVTYICIFPFRKKYIILWRSKKLQRQLKSITIVTIAHQIWCTFISGWDQAVQWDSTMDELGILWKRCPNSTACLHPFLHLWYIYDIYMDVAWCHYPI